MTTEAPTEAPNVNREGVTWFRALDGRAVRNERSRDGKARMLSVWSWSPEDEPTVEVKLIMNAFPFHSLSREAYAKGRREMIIMF